MFNVHDYQVINLLSPVCSYTNTENTYGWVPYHIQSTASCDTAPIHRYLSILREQTGDNYTRGGTHIFGRTGMCRSNGLLFYKKSLNMGPIFYQKILKHGSTFLTEPKFLGFRMAKNPENREILKNRPIFHCPI